MMEIQSQMSERALELLALPADRPCMVLDVGCGRGDVTHALIVPAVASAVSRKAESLRRTEAAARNRAGGGGCGRFFTKKVERKSRWKD